MTDYERTLAHMRAAKAAADHGEPMTADELASFRAECARRDHDADLRRNPAPQLELPGAA